MKAIDVVKASLRRINAYQPGEEIEPETLNDSMEALNDLLDSWSTDKIYLYGSNENILQWNSGQNQYTIGNPSNADVGFPNFIGSVTGNTITTTGVPQGLIAGANILNASTVTDVQGVIPSGTYVTAIASGSITLSQSVISAANSDTFSFTVPGDFGIARPLRITAGFTRFNTLDFTLDVYADQRQYTQILYKSQPGPWPTIAWYNNQFPYGILNVYQTPGNSAELHLFTDTILSNLSPYDQVVLPQGYSRALKWCLAKEICAEFGFPMTDAVKTNSADALSMIKALNAKPAEKASYDLMLMPRNGVDCGFVFHGGYS